MKKVLFLLLISNLLVAFLVSRTYLLLQNNLKNNGNWQSTKINLEMGVMGATNFFNQTQPLNGEKLNLGSWHGFQEIISVNKYGYDKVTFDVKFSEKSYLIFYYQISEDQKSGFKIDQESKTLSCLKIKTDGEFTSQNSFPISKNLNDQWIQIELVKRPENILVKTFDQEFICPKTEESEETSIGFKNGLKDVWIDNIELTNQGQTQLVERFDATKKLIPLTLTISAIILIFQIFLKEIFRKKNLKILSFSLIAVNITLTITLLISLIYLIFFFVGNYPNLNSVLSLIKRKEEVWVDTEVQDVSKSIMENFSNDPTEKIMFIGSSQTWGAGASSKNKSFPFQFEKLLNEEVTNQGQIATNTAQVLGVSTQNQFEVVNAGISGTTSNELLQEYESHWVTLKPKIVIINLSSNDFDYGVDAETFEKNLASFIEINKQNDIKTVLMIEARSPEIETDNLYQSLVAKVANSYQIPVIDANQFIGKQNDQGLLWWDFIHPTDFGHRLIAKYLLEEIEKYVPMVEQSQEQTSPQTSSLPRPTN